MDKKFTLKELIVQNNLCETKYKDYFSNGKIASSNSICFTIQLDSIKENKIENDFMISNPVIIFELDESSDLQFCHEFVFESIELISSLHIDKLYNTQIKIWNKIYGFEVKKIGSKIYFPIPFEALSKGNGILISYCKFQDITLKVKFSSSQIVNIISSCYMRIELLSVSKIQDYNIIKNYFYQQMKNEYYRSNLEKLINSKQLLIINKIIQNQFTGLEVLDNQLSYYKAKLYFNFYIDRFFICFQNLYDNSIYANTQQFETIEFIINGHIVKNYDYSDILFYNTKENLGYELPKGIYEIKWNLIEYKNLSYIDSTYIKFNGLTVPENYGIIICADASNYLVYSSIGCGIYFPN